MKQLLVVVVVSIISISFFSSCTAKCNTLTAEGAASCLCELTEEAEYIHSADKIKEKELSDKIIKIENEIKKAIDAGNYTKQEVVAIAEDRSCMITALLLPYNMEQD